MISIYFMTLFFVTSYSFCGSKYSNRKICYRFRREFLRRNCLSMKNQIEEKKNKTKKNNANTNSTQENASQSN